MLIGESAGIAVYPSGGEFRDEREKQPCSDMTTSEQINSSSGEARYNRRIRADSDVADD
jgi:hypothetical protein